VEYRLLAVLFACPESPLMLGALLDGSVVGSIVWLGGESCAGGDVEAEELPESSFITLRSSLF